MSTAMPLLPLMPSGQVEEQLYLLPHISITSQTPPHTTIPHLQLFLTNKNSILLTYS